MKQTILIVEDDAAMSSCIVEWLSATYRLDVAFSGISAVSTIHTAEDIDLVILDYKLPDLSGIEVLKEIKASKPRIPVLLITGYGDENLAIKAFRHGARDYLKKPFSSKELHEKIEFCLLVRNMATGKKREALFHESKTEISMNPSEVKPYNGYKIQKAISFIDDNFMTEISLDSVASKACMSKYHFSRTFKQAIGMNYQDYLNRRRVEKSKEMLRSSELTITEIAFSVGYNNISNFIRIFKGDISLTPSDYRRLHKKQNPFIPRLIKKNKRADLQD